MTNLKLTDLPAIEAKCIKPTNAPKTRFGETPLYSEGLYDLGSDIYAWMVPNGSWGESNAGLIKVGDKALLIDTLWDHNYTRIMLDTISQTFPDAQITKLINTHSDGDHFWGNYLLKDAEIISSDKSIKDMGHHTPKQMKLFNLVGQFFSFIPTNKTKKIGHWFQAMGKPYDFKNVIHTPARIGFREKLYLDFEGCKVELIEVGPAHRPGDLFVFIPQSKILFSGDILFIGSTPVIWNGPLQNWIDALDMILSMDVQTIVPGHGPITDKRGVELVKDYWLMIQQIAFKLFSQGKFPNEAAETIIFSDEFKESKFSNWDSPEKIMTNCHILYREYKGQNKPLKPLQIINMLSKQALLAHKLPEATPKAMRQSHQYS